MFQTLRSFIQRSLSPRTEGADTRTPTVYHLSHNSRSLYLTSRDAKGSSASSEIEWKAVKSLVARKRNLGRIKLICLSVNLDDGSSCEVTEEARGWYVLIEKLSSYLPGCQSEIDWWFAMVDPACKLKQMTIYQRNQAS
jgi:hypothetical protein